jgi:hypothetical protein
MKDIVDTLADNLYLTSTPLLYEQSKLSRFSFPGRADA